MAGHANYLNSSGLPTTKAELAALLRSKEEAREALYFVLHSLLIDYDAEILRVRFALSQAPDPHVAPLNEGVSGG
jgi:hypothetical protein